MSDRHTYILHLSPLLRKALAADAAETERSMNEIVRQALCSHYGMDCHEIRRGRRGNDLEAERIPLRVSEELFERVRKEAAWTARSMREVILDVLEKKYELTV